MKKYVSIILALTFVTLFAGCNSKNLTNEESSVIETVIVEKSYQAAVNEQSAFTVTLPETDILSAEDKAVKAEIVKHFSTDVDFRYSKQEIIQGKPFDITFSEIDSDIKGQEKVIYKNDFEDTFEFDAKSGKLRVAVINSSVTKKTSESIDKSTAQKASIKYAETRCDIGKYMLESYKELEKGYSFIYTRYIGGYPSNDRFSVWVGYDGNIIYMSDFTDVFTDKEINYDKSFIDTKITEYSDESKVDWDSVSICLHEGKVAVSYKVSDQHAIAILPLE